MPPPRLRAPVPPGRSPVGVLARAGAVIGQTGAAGSLAELADPRDMSEPIRVFRLTAAQLVTALLTAAARRLPG